MPLITMYTELPKLYSTLSLYIISIALDKFQRQPRIYTNARNLRLPPSAMFVCISKRNGL